MEASISLKNVTKRYATRQALKRISFGVEKGSIFCVAGPSGAGKSTLLEILTTQIRPDDGVIYIHGLNLAESPEKVRMLSGYMPDCNTLNYDATVYENLRLHGLLHGLKPETTASRVMRYLDRFQLLEFAHEMPENLSAGLQRRVVFTRAVMHHPEILYLDEPFAGVDYVTHKLMMDYLEEMHGNHTVFLSSRNLQQVEKIADRVVIMHAGEILTDGTPDKLKSDVQQHPHYRITFKTANPKYAELLKSLESVIRIEQAGRTCTLQLRSPADFANIVRQFQVDQIHNLQIISPDLSDVLFEFTDTREPEVL